MSIKVAFHWTLHAEGHQFREGPTGRHNQQLKKKRWPEVTLDGLHTDGCGISLAEAAALSEILTHGDNSFIESPEVGDNLMAHRERTELQYELRFAFPYSLYVRVLDIRPNFNDLMTVSYNIQSVIAYSFAVFLESNSKICRFLERRDIVRKDAIIPFSPVIISCHHSMSHRYRLHCLPFCPALTFIRPLPLSVSLFTDRLKQRCFSWRTTFTFRS